MALAIWGTLGLGGGGLCLWALLLIMASQRDGIGPTGRQLRAARHASDDYGRKRGQAALRS
jgi:hypothetical protein